MRWNPAAKIFFRLSVVYVFLFTTIAHTGFFFDNLVIWDYLVQWFGNNLLGFKIGSALYSSGSGSIEFDIALYVLMLSISGLIVLIWTALDYKRKNYDQLMQWFVIAIRFFLINEMIVYGFTKLFFIQFGELTTQELEQSIGDLTPMGMIWTMMAYSKGYTVFIGILQLTGGLFLVFRKTQTLGALIISGVMLNVVALNFFYDIPVKVFSLHLLGLALFLVCLDAKRIYNILLVNRATEPKIDPPLFKSKKGILIKTILKYSIITALVGYYLVLHLKIRSESDRYFSESGIKGVYDIYFFYRTSNRDMTLDDWKELEISHNNRADITCVSGKHLLFEVVPDSMNRFVVLENRLDRGTDTLQIVQMHNSYASFRGRFLQDTVEVGVNKRDLNDYKLTRVSKRH